ncbi:MAG: hypothetical protein ABR974_10175 [Bacteroidales bacterium]|jgi:hypothetical protein
MKKIFSKVILFGFSVACISLPGCYMCPKCFTPPESLRLRFISKIDSSDLISNGSYDPDSMKLFYYNRDQAINIPYQVIPDSTNKKSIFYSSEIAWISAEGSKNFFIRLNRSDLDTIFLDVVQKTDDCCTYYPYNSFKYNGQEIQLSKTEYVYIIKK